MYHLEHKRRPGPTSRRESAEEEMRCRLSAQATTSAMTDQKNQQWLNAVWDYLVHFKLKDYDYYDNSIKMINLIILSGNYWSPAS